MTFRKNILVIRDADVWTQEEYDEKVIRGFLEKDKNTFVKNRIILFFQKHWNWFMKLSEYTPKGIDEELRKFIKKELEEGK